MTPLEEAYQKIFLRPRPATMTEEDLAQLVLEGLSPELHGHDLVGRCVKYIYAHDDRFSDLVKWWARRDFDPEVAVFDV